MTVTVLELIAALQVLVEKGHGGTRVFVENVGRDEDPEPWVFERPGEPWVAL
jgi:hypothetical protein